MTTDFICFSHLRWNFVYQRPQHLLSRASREARVFFIEEPIFDATAYSYDLIKEAHCNVVVVVPHFEPGLTPTEIKSRQQKMLDSLISKMSVRQFILWYYSPMALSFSNHLEPVAIVYDCMDELSAFRFAPPELTWMENLLLQKADIVFTGGHSLYEAKKNSHHNIFSFPSSIDKEHFLSARNSHEDPIDQTEIPHPRIGFYGVLDERIDIELIDQMARLRPHWHFVLVGPVVKIDPASLPQHDNIHHLGSKSYDDLPVYLAGWDIAIMPFALNESTRFISPTKTPEFLCAGKPVISTPIADVVNDYGKTGFVRIAESAEEFVEAAEEMMSDKNRVARLEQVDEYLEEVSWDITWEKMSGLIRKVLEQKNKTFTINPPAYV